MIIGMSRRFWVFSIVLSFVFNARLGAQKDSAMSISEMHTLLESMINYSPDSSLVLLDLAASKIDKIQDKELAAEYWATNNLRRADYWLFSDPEKAMSYVEQAHEYYALHPDNKKLAEVFCLKAQIIGIQGKMGVEAIEKAIPFFDESLSYALKQNDLYLIAFVYYEYAFNLQLTERWYESLITCLEGVRYAELSGDSLSIASAYFLMGRTYQYFGFLESSEKCFSKAVNYGRGLDLGFTMIYSYANALYANGKTNLALQNYELALEMCLETGRLETATEIYASIGRLHLNEENFEGALQAYKAIEEIGNGLMRYRSNVMLFCAYVQRDLGNRQEALAYLEKLSSSIDEEFNGNFKIEEGVLSSGQLNIYKGIADLYFALDHRSEAALYYKKWGDLKDSVQTYVDKVQLQEFEKLYFNEHSKNEEISLKNEELEDSRATQAILSVTVILLLILGGGLVYFVRIRGLKENQKLKVAVKTRQLEQVLEGQETERQRIARELHDGIGQSLAALKMELQFDDRSSGTSAAVKRIDTLCNEVRTLSHQMMPLVLREKGLKEAVKQLLESSFRKSGIEVDFETSGMDERFSEKIEVHLYRITQELISNILKYADATKVSVHFLSRKEMITLMVEDNGRGYSVDEKFVGIGISNMRSRVEALSGTIRIQSEKTKGTYTYIAVPKEFHRNIKRA